jgi:hypothetical protein
VLTVDNRVSIRGTIFAEFTVVRVTVFFGDPNGEDLFLVKFGDFRRN